MSDRPLWTDWITAMATAATMAATGFAGVVAFLSYRRDLLSEMPIVEPNIAWKIDPENGRCIEINIKIVNRLDETIVVESARLRKPKSGYIGAGEYLKNEIGGPLHPVNSKSRTINLGWTIYPRGSYGIALLRAEAPRSDLKWEHLYIFPSPSWSGETIDFVLRVSSKALTIRDKRIVVRRRIPAMPASATQDAASKTG